MKLWNLIIFLQACAEVKLHTAFAFSLPELGISNRDGAEDPSPLVILCKSLFHTAQLKLLSKAVCKERLAGMG